MIVCRDLNVVAGTGPSARPLVCGVDLELEAGATLALVGESGSGKSLTARSLVGLLPTGLSARGAIEVDGVDLRDVSAERLRKLRAERVALVFQDPYAVLNPLRRVSQIMADCLGDQRPEERTDEIRRRLEEVGVTDPSVASRYPFELSGGLRQRVGLAAALARDPDVLIADEPTTALDVTTQRVVLELLADLRRRRNMALILITHDLRVAFSVCERMMVMYCGRVVESGPTSQIRTSPQHPYTSGLLRSEPPVARRVAKLEAMAGSVARPEDVMDRCCFEDRCTWRRPICSERQPPLIEIEADRRVACVRQQELKLPSEASLTSAAPSATGERDIMVRASNVCKSFRGRSGIVHALIDLSLEVPVGSSIAIVGESGSGKTTLARCIAGLERPTSGTIEFPAIEGSANVQFVFQDPFSSLNPAWSIGRSIREGFQRSSVPVDNVRAAVVAALRRVGLDADEYERRRPDALSGGQRQRVAIARALAAGPDLLICDEPVSALDVSIQAQLLNLLNDLRAESDMTYLLITHDLAVARHVADFVYVMNRGRVVEQGNADDVFDSPDHPYTQKLLASIPSPGAVPGVSR